MLDEQRHFVSFHGWHIRCKHASQTHIALHQLEQISQLQDCKLNLARIYQGKFGRASGLMPTLKPTLRKKIKLDTDSCYQSKLVRSINWILGLSSLRAAPRTRNKALIIPTLKPALRKKRKLDTDSCYQSKLVRSINWILGLSSLRAAPRNKALIIPTLKPALRKKIQLDTDSCYSNFEASASEKDKVGH